MATTLVLEGGHSGIVHALLEAHYVQMNTTADEYEARSARSAQTIPGFNPEHAARIVAAWREEADNARQIGQLLELADPSLEQAEWRWPRP